MWGGGLNVDDGGAGVVDGDDFADTRAAISRRRRVQS